MKVDKSDEGIVVDAEDLGALLGLEPAEVPDLMKTGRITSRFEQGEGDDAEKFRVTFLFEGRQVRLTCAMDGTVLSTFRSPKIA
ncbi:DUF6522 family protein [Pseudahrensia aquimaris]|uniref:DUF6522 family protein n=1 Tax=Pseudahrensia aquimaris TaxID=744461 RepID=A0ABW3FC09_9HYPH